MTDKPSARNTISQLNEDPIIKDRVETITAVWEELGPLMSLSHVQAYKESLLKKDAPAATEILRELEKAAEKGIIKVRQLITRLKSKRWRAAIARELHDTILQNLTTLFFELQYCRKLLESDCSKALEEYSSLKNLVLDNKLSMDQFPFRYNRETIGYKFVPSLIEYAEKFSDLSGIKVQIDIEGEKRNLSSEASDHLFLIFKEALINVKRHARAKKVNVSLMFEHSQFALTIADDGKGFVLKKRRDDYFGIKGMKERAKVLGGTLAVQTQPGRGTEVFIAIPLDGHSSSSDIL